MFKAKTMLNGERLKFFKKERKKKKKEKRKGFPPSPHLLNTLLEVFARKVS